MIEWIKGIVAFMILEPLIFLIVPNEHYKKYISYYLALLFILVLIQPIGNMLNVDTWYQWIEELLK
jgi:hypothetical protein